MVIVVGEGAGVAHAASVPSAIIEIVKQSMAFMGFFRSMFASFAAVRSCQGNQFGIRPMRGESFGFSFTAQKRGT
jgi:hypothetical protein